MLDKGVEGIVGAATNAVSDTLDAMANTVTVWLDAASMRRVDELVEAELFPDRASATMFLVAEGLKANAEVLGEIRARSEESCSVKEQPPGPGGRAGFNSTVRGTAIEALKQTVARHETVRQSTTRASERLFEQRKRVAHEVIERIERYVNCLANSPREFDKTVAEYRIEAGRFDQTIERLGKAARSTKVGGASGVAGAMAGVGVATLGPSVALAVATAFGTASTGAAISALSGAAATSAALAWLGGSALAAGGGGMAAGSALLALAGPAGWTVAGAVIVGAAVYLHVRNRQCAEEATKQRIRVEAEPRALEVATREIESLAERTEEDANGCLATSRG